MLFSVSMTSRFLRVPFVELPLVPGGKLFLHMLQSFDKVLVRGLIMAHDTGDPHIAVLPDGIQNADFFHFGHLPSLHG